VLNRRRFKFPFDHKRFYCENVCDITRQVGYNSGSIPDELFAQLVYSLVLYKGAITGPRKLHDGEKKGIN